ncbi:hypothetical protein SmJEL517_g05873 [Synchytrium microbalum]|uniref:Uncharacterized protein n=1 Tax=Synchytrium microbalum TaxID=1806994 RepID=A0A507BTA7_9FUNG|nr:uncharacterized protein SmJEL517_g05873 [Synchytrium microbalum]TPX30588.1 hypothetical protein SmJEL517_g05873 [Synchytrium microbalum]
MDFGESTADSRPITYQDYQTSMMQSQPQPPSETEYANVYQNMPAIDFNPSQPSNRMMQYRLPSGMSPKASSSYKEEDAPTDTPHGMPLRAARRPYDEPSIPKNLSNMESSPPARMVSPLPTKSLEPEPANSFQTIPSTTEINAPGKSWQPRTSQAARQLQEPYTMSSDEVNPNLYKHSIAAPGTSEKAKLYKELPNDDMIKTVLRTQKQWLGRAVLTLVILLVVAIGVVLAWKQEAPSKSSVEYQTNVGSSNTTSPSVSGVIASSLPPNPVASGVAAQASPVRVPSAAPVVGAPVSVASPVAIVAAPQVSPSSGYSDCCTPNNVTYSTNSDGTYTATCRGCAVYVGCPIGYICPIPETVQVVVSSLLDRVDCAYGGAVGFRYDPATQYFACDNTCYASYTSAVDQDTSSSSNLPYVAVAGTAIAILTATAYYLLGPSYKRRRIRNKRESSSTSSPLLDHSSRTARDKAMSVVGIDFGNQNTVVAVARNRGIDVIVNEVSNRATPSLVSFGEKQRYLGESAKTQEIGNFKNTVGCLKRLIGRTFKDPEITKFEKKFINSDLVEAESGEVAAGVMYQNERQEFAATQIAGMFFTKVKEYTGKELKAPVTDVVISCPGWFTDRQRRALHEAAEVAGLNPLRIMNDTTAAALGYGITKTDLPDIVATPTAKPRIVVFVDVGESSYQVSVVSFVKGKLIVKAAAYDRNLGGRNFDEVLVEHFIEEFKGKYKIDIGSNAKARYRLRAACEKVKKVLSANSMTQLAVECIMDDKDVQSVVNRADFETMAASLIQRFEAPIKEALESAGVTPAEVDFVELVGGGTRVPSLKQFLANMFDESKLSTTLNQDEAVARGCALQCAVISPVFKVRDFSVQDWNSYPVQLSWDPSVIPTPKSGEKETKMEVFPVANAIPSTKVLTFYRSLNDEELAAKGGSVTFELDAHYIDPDTPGRDIPSGVGTAIGKWTIQGIKKPVPQVGDIASGAAEKAQATIRVKAKLDGNAIVSMEAAQQIEEALVAIKDDEPAAKDAKKPETKENGSSAMDTDDVPADSTESLAESAQPVPPKTKRIVRKHDLTIVAKTTAHPREVITKWHAAELEMDASDRLVIDTADRKNALEEYVYETRSKLEMAWSEYITDADRQSVLKELSATEDWLYGEGEDSTKSVYSDKLKHLKSLGDPVAFRYREWDERARAERMFREYANSVLIALAAEDGRFAHIPAADLDKVSTEVHKKLDWLNQAISKQNAMERYQDVHVTVDKINQEKTALFHTVNPILTRPKPAPKKEEPAAAPATPAETPAPETPATPTEDTVMDDVVE